ncbi:ATP synthase subunit alpha, mitochondrial [Elsinoe australis]|uniref:ATP synthase subunit alpha, mitochondrial n=1 Tax=Elsinoe australis TaxID=40998 RepID=A0A2P7ZK58_9PEZI|nr:ATP synthase subunit alpha, mitochondrial [Elsinoe australis]
MSQQELAAIKAAAIDGRAQPIFYRLSQLQKLRDTLVEQANQIQDAIKSDSGITSAEAKIEYSLAVETVRTRYTELADFEKVLEQEYSVAKGKDDPSRRHGVGTALIKPSSHSLFYSTIAPLAAAIAAGNVVIIQFENSTRTLPNLLKSLLKPALDHDSITFTSTTPQLDTPHVIVSQSTDNTTSHPANHIVSPFNAVSIALVDRNADFDAAATSLINARFSHRGRSPHAPDLVLVNEFAKKPLLQALVRATIASADSAPTANGTSKSSSASSDLKPLLSTLEKSSARIIVQESTGAVLDLPTRSPSLLSQKITQPALLVHSVRSLDDAIDFLTQDGRTYLSAAYFSDLGSGKYLSQFVPSQASFLNGIPEEVLVGPAFPLSFPASGDAVDRFTVEMFSAARPAFVAGKAKGKGLEGAGLTATTNERNKKVQELYKRAVEALPVQKRRKQLAAGFGFFEQAFILHFGFAVLTTLVSVGSAGWWLKSGRGWRPWR